MVLKISAVLRVALDGDRLLKNLFLNLNYFDSYKEPDVSVFEQYSVALLI